ncbi:hypothetical protein [Blastococcus sp. LR1]|uniref:hypothetical protein n=1 Tax=Blastococcus sp. LR1 TaxID=2877000 RepID=UPI001CCB2D0D|nr:hypothetical protein [Blastococcus sp. LR1]MCA0144611.1 hypothetical protein [Blastococcus sp. LR1]
MTAAQNRLGLVVPEDWWRLPLTDDAALRRAVDTAVARQFRGVDNQPVLRRESAEALLERARRARAGGGVDMYLSLDPVAGVPIGVSLVVSLIPQPPDLPTLEAVARDMTDDEARPVLVDLGGSRAVRRQRVQALGHSELGVPAGQELLLVDYTFEGPRGTLLLLSFSSPLVVVADALAELFESVAHTVRWSA